EILSAMQEKVPNLPEVDPAEMASLRTLGSIVEFMAQASSGGSAQTADEKKKSSAPRVRRYTLETVDSPASSFAPANLFHGKTLWVTDEGRGIGAELVSVLNKKGLKAELTKDLPSDAECVIILEGLSHSQSVDEALNVNRKCFEFTCAVAPKFEERGGFFFMAQDTGGQFGGPLITETGAWSGGLSGLVKTAAQEWPSATVRVLDIHCSDKNPSEIAASLATEILSGGVDREVALSQNGRRTKIHCSPVDAGGGQPAVNSDSVIIVSGGGRGVTAAATKALARNSKASFALLGRTALEDEPSCCHGIDEAGLKKALLMDSRSKGEKISPAELGKRASRISSQREIRQTLSELESAGSKAAYFSCDVTNVESVNGVFEDVRARFGAITGIVHGAGVLADKMLSQKTMDQFDRVFNTKVRGLRTLLEASANDPLTMMVFFSSVAARSGNIGQSDYALSNEILNRVADYESKTRGAQCKVKSMAWGPWESGMVSAALKARFEQMGVPLIPLKEGAELFVKEIQQGRHEVVNVVIGGPPLDQPLAHPAAQVSKKMTALVGAAIQPHLKSHQISDVAVLPLVLVEEWFARAARSVHSDYNVVKVEKLQVVRGIQLHQFNDGFEHFDVEIEPLDSNGQCTARLIDPDNKIRFTAKVSLKTEYSSAPKAPAISGLETVSLSGTALYQDRLFHGPDFAAIKEIDGLGKDGASALLQGTLSFPWPGEDWVTDPALIDGGLQLARIWGYEKLDGPTLPTSLESLVLYRSGLIEGPVRCLLRGQTMGKAGTRSDLWFIDQSGQVIAEIQGLKMHVALSETSGARS
ncbi:MAG: SDR family NAD(P)-dependent oxidoreductase, partial [Planctomycetota bacterium]|nr:SDR family NAD(P)-dependent oxidoreductase [Planctomycetota bacterium]